MDRLTVTKCRHCGKRHTVDAKYTTKGGRTRVSWTCPNTGSKVSTFAKKPDSKPAKAKKPRKRSTSSSKGGGMPRQSKVTGRRGALKGEIPFVQDVHPDIDAAWDIAEGIMDGLAGLHGDNVDALRRRAESAYARAKGLTTEGDETEHDFGVALAEAIMLVAIKRRMTAADWKALAPPGIGTGAREYMGGQLIDFAVGEEGESGAMGIAGDLLENTVGYAIGEILPEGTFGDAVRDAGAPIIADGIRDMGLKGAVSAGGALFGLPTGL